MITKRELSEYSLDLIINTIPFLRALNQKSLSKVKSFLQPFYYPKNHNFLTEGEEILSIHILLNGLVKSSNITYNHDSSQEFIADILGKKELIDIASVLENRNSPAN